MARGNQHLQFLCKSPEKWKGPPGKKIKIKITVRKNKPSCLVCVFLSFIGGLYLEQSETSVLTPCVCAISDPTQKPHARCVCGILLYFQLLSLCFWIHSFLILLWSFCVWRKLRASVVGSKLQLLRVVDCVLAVCWCVMSAWDAWIWPGEDCSTANDQDKLISNWIMLS